MAAKFTAVSVFSGAGGLDYGFEAAGFKTVFATDFDPDCCQTLRSNRPAWNIWEGPVSDLSGDLLLQTAKLKRGEIDVLFGGPPCQPFSKSAYWSRGDTLRLNDPRADTLSDYFRLVSELRPRAFLLENVHGINYSGKEEGFQFVLESIREINKRCGTAYRPTWRVVNAADHGVPQNRVRFILIASESGQEFVFPNPTHVAEELEETSIFEERPRHTRAWDAIGHVVLDPNEDLSVGGKWADLLPSIPEGENYLWHTNRKGGMPLFGWRTHYWSFLLKLAKEKPSWTLQAQPGSAIGPFHWNNRRLSVAELSALQTFPTEIKVKGSRTEVQRQLGNAVPSLLAEVMAREIQHQFFGVRLTDAPKLAVKPSATVPLPEKPQPVPVKYHHLVGEHADHAGTGKGASYQNGKRLVSAKATEVAELRFAF